MSNNENYNQLTENQFNSENSLRDDIISIKTQKIADINQILDFPTKDFEAIINKGTNGNGSTASKKKRRRNNARQIWKDINTGRRKHSPIFNNLIIDLLQEYLGEDFASTLIYEEIIK